MLFRNPLLPQGQDPYVIYHDGWYYHCFVNESFGWGPIRVRKSRTIPGLATAEPVQVWTPPSAGLGSRHLWAPEMHFIHNRWYIYYSAADEDGRNHRIYVLESDSEEPQGWYHPKGKLSDESDKWAIDGTVLQKPSGELYFIWSGDDDEISHEQTTYHPQNIYVTPMKNPWTLIGRRTCISKPTYAWEKNGPAPINEGPQVLEKNGKYFIVYSASHSLTDDYCLGLLINETGDILNLSAWKKYPEPVFHKTDSVFGPGHCSFTTAPDGKDWIFYHSARHQGSGWDRQVHAQPFTWTRDGLPDFGIPQQEVILS
jgi:GH43 family beta-xylosidase